jgi:hypothetical protein
MRTVAAGAGLGISSANLRCAPSATETAIIFSPEHQKAVNRRRRIVVQYDAFSEFGADFNEWLAYRFNYADEPGTQIDSLWWDMSPLGYACYPSKVLEPYPHAGLAKWRDQGIDWVGRVIAETRRRNLEVFWHHRISEVDMPPAGQGTGWDGWTHPIKRAHSDWVIKTWWKQGLWNLAVAGVREYTVSILRELAEMYPLDGFQIDFARHVPCLPPGRQWELRGHVTELMRMVRTMLLEVARQRGRPILLAAKVPQNLKGCRIDGLDVEAWAGEGLVDIFTLGSRTMEVDIAAFRRLTTGRNIKLQPCFDDHHTTDAYQYAPVEFLRGVFGNWHQQGADSVCTFNWSNAAPELCRKMGVTPGPPSHRQAYHEVGSPETLRFKDKVFAVDRRGGYPWAEGYFNRNDDAQLPAPLGRNGPPASIRIAVGDNVRAEADRVRQVTLRLILYGTSQAKDVEVRLNGVFLEAPTADPTWKDKLIFTPRPQPASGGADRIKVDSNQRLLRLDYPVDPRACHLGPNQVDVRPVNGSPGQPASLVQLEKVEVLVQYAP